MQSKAKRTYKYLKSEKVSTDALARYKKEHKLSYREIAERSGETVKNIANWSSTKRVPRVVLEKLNIKARNSRPKSPPHSPASGASIYLCYVSKDKEDTFTSIMSGLKIETKFVV